MTITEDFAKKIVHEMKDIIDYDLNFMDNDGIIIASTDTKRKGFYHEGAKRAILNHKNFVVNFNGEYPGTRKGINMPVYFGDEIAGVIGITGDKNEVEKYGEIIKKMTEILIKEAYLKDLDVREIEQHRILIEDLLFNDKQLRGANLISQTNLFEISSLGPKLVIVSNVLYQDSRCEEVKDKVFKIYYNNVTMKSNNLIMQSRDILIMVIEFENVKKIKKLLQDIHYEVRTKYNLESKFGIGTTVDNIKELKSSYLKSKIALDVAIESDIQNIVFYEDMDLELMLNLIPRNISSRFVRKTFKNLSAKDVDEFDALFKSYEKHNGSINKIAQELFLHKNTIQYRLNLFSEKLDYDMRRYEDFALLKIAMTLKKVNN